MTKGEIAQNKQFLLLPKCIQLFFSNHTFILKEFSCLHLEVFKFVCCRFVVCGKGLKKGMFHFYTFVNTVDMMIYMMIDDSTCVCAIERLDTVL